MIDRITARKNNLKPRGTHRINDESPCGFRKHKIKRKTGERTSASVNVVEPKENADDTPSLTNNPNKKAIVFSALMCFLIICSPVLCGYCIKDPDT